MSTTTVPRSEAPPRAESHAGWRVLGITVLSCLVTIAGLDAAFHRLAPPVHLTEVEDAVGLYQRSNPTVLVVGSSHARSFAVVNEELRTRTGGREEILAVPVEWGKLNAYRWVIENRLEPLADEVRAGSKVRDRLKRFILVTEWWDSVPPEGDGRYTNLPARAWRFRDFLGDVSRNGLDAHNRNYAHERWKRLWWSSSLVQDHGHGKILEGLKGVVRPPTERALQREYERDITSWRKMVDNGARHMLDPQEMEAFDQILAWAKARGLDVTVLLYPRMPGTLTDLSKRTTLAEFSRAIAARPSMAGVRFVDFTTSSPLEDVHYSRDFDHVTREGNELFSDWALDGELSFLVEGS